MRQKSVILLFLLPFMAACFLFEDKEEVNSELPENLSNPSVDSLVKYNPQDLYEQAKSLLSNQEVEQASPYIQAALLQDSTNYKYLLLGSDIMVAGDEIIKAQMLLQNGMLLYPDSAAFPIRMAETFLYVNRQEDAIASANDALRLNPYNPYPYFLKGFAFKELGDTSKAISTFQTSVEQDPNFYDGYIQLTLLHSQRKDDLALQYVENALSLQPTSREALYAKAYHYQYTGRLTQAIQEYKTAIKAHPQDEQFYYNMGICYYDLDSLNKAYDHFEMAVGVAPNYAEAYYMMGLLAERAGDYALAEKQLNNALRLSPGNDIVLEALDRVKKTL